MIEISESFEGSVTIKEEAITSFVRKLVTREDDRVSLFCLLPSGATAPCAEIEVLSSEKALSLELALTRDLEQSVKTFLSQQGITVDA